ncbi:predicted protein, partial [Micromonas commoda]
GLEKSRRDLTSRATGDVLELGVGTGLNLPGYDLRAGGAIRSLTAVDISGGMLNEARTRADELGFRAAKPPPVRFVVADVENLPFPDSTFDCVVDTFSLCVFEHPETALAELRRVLKPGGVALLVEHSRSQIGPLGAYQDAVAAPVKALAKGCAWNQDVVGLVEGAGL